MPVRRREKIASVLRSRIEGAVSARAIVRGDRLPSTREMAKEMGVDPRTIAAAYRALADEGLVELRSRSGVFATPQTTYDADAGTPSPDWLTSVLADAIQSGYSTRDFCDHLRDAALGRRLRVAVIAATYDQTAGMCRELKRDYGLEATGVLADGLKRGAPVPNALRRAQLLVTTEMHRTAVDELARALGKVAVVAQVRSDVFDDWISLLRSEVFVIATDPRFLAMLQSHIATLPGAGNVTLLIAGRDDLSIIPPSAPTYVTQAAREALGKTRMPWRLIQPARVFDSRSVEQLLAAIIRINTAN